MVRVPQIGSTGARVNNRLGQRIAQLIEAQGPLSVAQFMTMALHDPRDGYYAARQPIGAKGDFITAPEISQMLGELLGLWCIQVWRDQGSPASARLVELGPGRGTLMADLLRAARIDPEFLAAIEILLIEASPNFQQEQARRLSGGHTAIRWLPQFDESLLDRPFFLIANEFLDALPIRQFVHTERGWCERMVTVDEECNLAFALSPVPAVLDIPPERGSAETGAVYESAPAAESLVEQVASAIAAKGGAALILDYGYGPGAGFGETLQAVSRHKFASILENPGESDLSAHVDFSAIVRAARRGGAMAYGPFGQGAFLCNLGIERRAKQLAGAGAETAMSDLDRLISLEKMAALFKALAIAPKAAPKPPGF